jgi:hypothetical protein
MPQTRCLSSFTRRLLAATALCLPLLAQADPVPLFDPLFVPFEGSGNVSVFDAAAGTGGWTGSITQSSFPAVPAPLALVSVLLFQLDAATQTLSGTFEFTTTDLASTLFGEVSGSYLDADILLSGGQFSLNYNIAGGSGMFLRASGYGLSFLDFSPAPGAFDNYAEAGALVFSVAEPGTLALAAFALLAMWVHLPGTRRARP